MERAVGGILKLLGDGVTIATVLFVCTVIVARAAPPDWPAELTTLNSIADALASWFGPGWWALLIGAGAVLGFTLSAAGRRRLDGDSKVRSHYR